MLSDNEKKTLAQQYAFEKLIDLIENIDIDSYQAIKDKEILTMKLSKIFYRYNRLSNIPTNPLHILANMEFMNDLSEEVEHG